MRRPSILNLCIVLAIGLACGLCDEPSADCGTAVTTGTGRSVPYLPTDGPTQADFPDLHNLLQVHATLFSGGEPKSEAAFCQLSELGITSIVSVDGARPNLALAEKYGMRYVHIPLGYDGIDTNAAKSLIRAARELTGMTYVHCHHGRHRGPAGAAAICVAQGRIEGRDALRVLEKAGTGKEYGGLWADVRNFQVVTDVRELPALVSVADVKSLAATMAAIDHASDNLRLCKLAGWRTPADHLDISPPQEALLLREGFHEMLRQFQASNDFDDRFLTWMQQAEGAAARLQSALDSADAPLATRTFHEIQAQCRQCHTEYRD